ncbi:MAG: hypothetical protein N4A45_00605 [Flavobacteriales bacterium]|jgi:hypothetical protein|nr:hypothetical protein [Flavobacteriales bacterium]
MKIGRKIYYEKTTGNILVDTGERSGFVKQTTKEDDFKNYLELSKRNEETVGVLNLEYGQFVQDFSVCVGYRVNLEDESLEFLYPTGDEKEDEIIEPQRPMSEELKEMKDKISGLQRALAEVTMMKGV